MKNFTTCALSLIVLLGSTKIFSNDIQECLDQFPGHAVSGVPSVQGSPPGIPYNDNQHFCFRDNNQSYFALEYSNHYQMPVWVAYKLSPNNYANSGCNTVTEAQVECYFGSINWSEFEQCRESNSLFHQEPGALNNLDLNAFEYSGHVRAPLAPFAAFSWSACAAKKTFSTVNAVPQTASLHQTVWRDLDAQILTWARDKGELFVFSGPIFHEFPYESFTLFQNRVLDPAKIYPSATPLRRIVGKHYDNFRRYAQGDILRPALEAIPSKINPNHKNLIVPTGFFKIVYFPGENGNSPHTIAFLIPHSFENLDFISDKFSYLKDKQDFWKFMARADLVEQISGVSFSGIPKEQRASWGDPWYLNTRGSARPLRENCSNSVQEFEQVSHFLIGSTLDARIAECATN